MISMLGAGAGSDVWFAYSAVDPPSARMYEELSSIFAAAGWRVRGVERLSFRTRAGYFLYAAEDTAPANFEIIGRALHATGTDPQVFLGYREYARERAQANPSWQGISLGADQPMAVMIGRQGQ